MKHMKKIILFLCLIFSIQVFCQPERFRRRDFKEPIFNKILLTQTIIIPSDSISSVYFLYKIAYQNLVFLKNGNSYSAEVRMSIEISDTNDSFVKREIKDWKIEAVTFDQTNSPDLFAEGFIEISLAKGKFNIEPVFIDQNSKKEHKIEKSKVEISDSTFIEPIIVDSKKIEYNGNKHYKLTNFENGIPFGSGSYDIIIPVKDMSVSQIDVTIVSLKDTLINTTITESFISSIDFSEHLENIIVTEGDNLQSRNFVLSGLNGKLKEGEFEIIVNNKINKRFKENVLWYNKPFSLKNPRLSSEALKFVENENVVDSLLDLDEENYYRSLVDYWKKIDPTPETEYNELMNEFYSRVDHVQKNFSSLTGKSGIDTDRGMIFIKFGKPNSVERSSSENGKVIETWIYEKPQRKFVFIDKQGVGEFSLENS